MKLNHNAILVSLWPLTVWAYLVVNRRPSIVGAMALGTETIEPVHMLVGPGNIPGDGAEGDPEEDPWRYYAEQPRPEGLAQAFVIGREFVGSDRVALALGDNIFFGPNFPDIIQKCTKIKEGGMIFGYPVKDPERYGVVDFEGKRVRSIIEKHGGDACAATLAQHDDRVELELAETVFVVPGTYGLIARFTGSPKQRARKPGSLPRKPPCSGCMPQIS